MNPGELQKILAARFNRTSWLEVVREMLPGAAIYLTPQSVAPEATRAKAIWQLGEVSLADGKTVAVLEVEVSPSVDLARNRAGLRALAARFIDQARYHGVIAAFRTEGREDWRLTFAARESAFDPSAAEFTTSETAPRRYTYLLGPDETCRTPAERLLALRRHGSVVTLANVTEAFSVEELNKEFFRDFCDVFNIIVEELGNRFPEWKNEDSTRELAQQETQILLNRLLFLYFVQRKGWLHRDPRYLVGHFRGHFEAHPGDSSYYEKFLFPVFRILSTEWGAREKTVSHLSDQDPRRHDLPFLNGGLFHDDDLNDDASRRRKALGIRNETLGRVFDQLLERYNFTIREDSPLDQEVAIDPEMLGKIFEELILREESGESGSGKTKRHDTGSHYTPRPIVHYLCREALAAWLEKQPPFEGRADATDSVNALLTLDAAEGLDDADGEKLRSLLTPDEAGLLLRRLEELRACDPAVGSGAFPIGLLHELLNLAHLADSRARGHDPTVGELAWVYDTKKGFIRRSLYGVDIQERATEICKLRLWLSLMVDHDLGVNSTECDRRSFQNALRKLEPLPNLDFKIRRANSLVDTIHGHIVDLQNLQNQTTEANRWLNQLASAKLGFFNALKQEEKRKLRSEIYEALAELGRVELLRVKSEETGIGIVTSEEEFQRLDEIIAAERELTHALKLAKTARSRNESAATRERMLEQLERFFGDTKSPTFVWQLDFAEVFYRRNLKEIGNDTINDHLERNRKWKEGGFDLLLGNPPYVRLQTLTRDQPKLAEYFKHRYRAASKGNYDLYVVFVERGLELLTHRGQLAYILPHKFFNLQYGKPLRGLLAKGQNLRHVVHFGVQQIFPGATNYVCLLFLSKSPTDEVQFVRVTDLQLWLREFHGEEQKIPTSSFTSSEWNFLDSKAGVLVRELNERGVRLLGVPAEMSRGSSTGDDDVFMIENGSDLVESDILRIPVFATDFGKYSFSPNQAWRIIFPYRHTESGFELIPERELAKTFPKAFEYLKRNRAKLNSRKGARHWYGYSAARNLSLHDRAHMLIPLLAFAPSFAEIPSEFLGKLCPMASGGFTVTVDENASVSPRYILGMLNSKVLFWRLQQTSNSFQGGWITCTKQYFGELPIPIPKDRDTTKKFAVERIVDVILFLHKQETVRQSVASAPRDPLIAQYFEQWMDALAYQLFFPEELKVAQLDFFKLFAEANIPGLETWRDSDRLPQLRKLFERLYDPSHALRGALFALQSLELVRKIEGHK